MLLRRVSHLCAASVQAAPRLSSISRALGAVSVRHFCPPHRKKAPSGSFQLPHGLSMFRDPLLSKGSAYTKEERNALDLRGLVPPAVESQATQVRRVMWNMKQLTDDFQKYLYLATLQDENQKLYYRVLRENIDQLMPIVYTPVVGKACQEFSHIWRHPRGLFISSEDAGNVRRVLRNWPAKKIDAIVVTDGERILGLGDQGADGMGIPIGKLALYSACAGIDPATTLPVTIDVGTDNQQKLADDMYIGLRKGRDRSQAYWDLIDEFVTGCKEVFGERVLIQWEDFGNSTAFKHLQKYRNTCCTFNDDIQGTAAVAVAGLMATERITKTSLRDQRFLFLGAGEAGLGIADLIAQALVADHGLTMDQARQNIFMVDSKGLICRARTNLPHNKRDFAHEVPYAKTLKDAIHALRPTALVGVSAQPKAFTEDICRQMASHCERPIIFALSNPTAKAECTAAEAYQWTEGRAIFSSGSPFPAFEYNGKKLVPGQGNNAYIFPGIGLGIIATKSERVTDRMMLVAARSLANQVHQENLDVSCVYPKLSTIAEVSAKIAADVADEVFRAGLAGVPRPNGDLLPWVKQQMFSTDYEEFLLR